jgi:hypothetical protein
MIGLMIACGLLVACLVVWLAVETWWPQGLHVRQAPAPKGIIVSERADVVIIADAYVFNIYRDGHLEVTAPDGVTMFVSAPAAMGLTWHLARQYGWITAGHDDGKGPP